MIDKEHALKLTQHIIKNIFSSEYRYSGSEIITNFEMERENLMGECLSKLWDKLMSFYEAYAADRPLLLSEKALACLIRRGADRKNIRLNGTNAKVRLNNLTYYVEKEGFGCTAGPCCTARFWCNLPMRWVSLSGEDFADFMFEFDELVPALAKEVDDRLLETKVKAKQYEILSQSAGHLGEIFLTQNGIRWQVGTDFTESEISVTFSDGTHLPIRETIPLDKLTDVFQSIPDRMNSRPLLPKRKPRKSMMWDDLF